MLKNSSTSYGWLHIALHWLSALTVFGLFLLGLWMKGLDYYHPAYRTAPDLHKSIGVLLILVTFFRLFWRHIGGVPASLTEHASWEKLLSKLVHIYLYAAIVSMFFSGYLITTAKGQSLDVFGLVSIPALVTGVDSLEHLAEDVHELTAWSIVAIAILHGLAALKHHILDKDTTLKRMLKPSR